VIAPEEKTLIWAFADVVTKLTAPLWPVVASWSVKLADFVVDTLPVVPALCVITTAATVAAALLLEPER
jgi:hypothetical protein